MIENVGWVTHD